MVALRNLALLAGRIFIAAVFIYDATLLARFPGDNLAYMLSFGLPSFVDRADSSHRIVRAFLLANLQVWSISDPRCSPSNRLPLMLHERREQRRLVSSRRAPNSSGVAGTTFAVTVFFVVI